MHNVHTITTVLMMLFLILTVAFKGVLSVGILFLLSVITLQLLSISVTFALLSAMSDKEENE